MSGPLYCKVHGDIERPLLQWIGAKPDGTPLHLKATCPSCGRYLGFVPQDKYWLDMMEMQAIALLEALGE